MYNGNGANTTHLFEPFNEFPSCSQLPIHPPARGWEVPGCGMQVTSLGQHGAEGVGKSLC